MIVVGPFFVNDVSSNELCIAALQGTGFFVSILLLGFAYGHESVMQKLMVRELGFDKTKPPWQQPALMRSVKIKTKAYFPRYWLWGNVRASLIFGLMAMLTDVSGATGPCRSAAIAATLIALTNAFLYSRSAQPDWNIKEDS